MIQHVLEACFSVGWFNLLVTALFLTIMIAGVLTCGWATLRLWQIAIRNFLEDR